MLANTPRISGGSSGSGTSGANTALSNLVIPTSINQDLLPGVTGIDLGNSSAPFNSLAVQAGIGTATDPDIYWWDSVHVGKIGFRANQTGSQGLFVSMGGEDCVLIEANGNTPFLIAGLQSAKILNVGGTQEPAGLEGISDGAQPTYSNPSLVLTAPANSGETAPQHFIQQSTVKTTNSTPTLLHTYNLATNSAAYLEYNVTAIRTAGTSGSTHDSAWFNIKVMYKDVSGTATIVGSGATPVIITYADNTNLAVSFSVSSLAISLMVMGDTNNTYQWHQTLTTDYVH